jgi:hypothetical protein
MKKSSAVFALIMLAYPVLAQKAREVDAIKAVIEKETKAYFSIDQKAWMDCWAHVPHAYWSFVDQTQTSHFEGWNAIEIGFNDYFVTSKPNNIQIERQWIDVRVYNSGAFARFKQYVITDGIRGPEQTEMRILEKDKNSWKIVMVAVLKKGEAEATTSR